MRICRARSVGTLQLRNVICREAATHRHLNVAGESLRHVGRQQKAICLAGGATRSSADRWKGRLPLKALQRGTGAGFYEQVLQIYSRAGFAPNVVQEATEPPTIFDMGAAGIAITIAMALPQAIHIEDIVWRELDLGQEAVSSIRLVTNTRQSTNTGLCRASSPPALRTSPI
jgi:hypothetical protein